MGIREWLKVNEFKINVALLAVFVLMFAAAMLFNSGVLACIGILGIIFFATYSVYGYVRVKGIGPE